MQYKPEEDGITHVNIYSKGQTILGRFLSNFQYAPFECEDGKFDSIEGYWYWISSGDDKLRTLSGFAAKSYGRKIKATEWLEDSHAQDKIKNAIIIKINNNTEMKEAFIKCDIPFTHYYVYGDKIVEPENGKWIIESINEYKKSLE